MRAWTSDYMNDAFQYPQADRRGCNWLDGDEEILVIEFQYPQADRRGCNPLMVELRQFLPARFSIHKRIEGGATRDTEYPRCANHHVSVSTSGSKGVQQPFFARFFAVFLLSASFRAVLKPFF